MIGEGGTTSGVAVVTNEHTRMKAMRRTKLAQTVMTITDELPMILIGDLNGGHEKREARSIRGLQISDETRDCDPTGSATPYSINAHQQ